MAMGDAATLRRESVAWRVDSTDWPIVAENVVVALGPWSGELLHRLGYQVPIFFKRRYHQHFAGKGPVLPLMDAERGVVVAPMKAGLRLLTGAELAWLDSSPTRHQIRNARRAAGELFELGEPVETEAWLKAPANSGTLMARSFRQPVRLVPGLDHDKPR
jgi:D-amino-acid dehydrogenase